MQGTPTRFQIPVAIVTPSTPSAQQRYLALDALRGFIMFVLVSRGFGLAALAKRNPAFTGIANQFEHMPWEWIAFWDLIQPAFMFMVGVATPFALARRLEQGATERQLFWHVAARSLRLILMSQILISISGGKLSFQLTNVLAQIGITYFLCYLIMQLEFRWQAAIAALILIGHWALFVAFPGNRRAIPLENDEHRSGGRQVPVRADQPRLLGHDQHHHKHRDDAVRGVDFAPVGEACAVLMVMWGLCYWLYRRKIFLKL